MKEKGCECIILSALDDVAWLFNLRGADIAYNPVFFSYAAITEGEAILFINPSQVNDRVRASLADTEMGDVSIVPYSAIKDWIQKLQLSESGKVWFRQGFF